MRKLFLSMIAILTVYISCKADANKAYRLYLKGKEAYFKQELDTAKKYFTEASEIDPSLINARLMLAKTYYFQKNFDEALEILSSILAENSDHPGSLFWKARTLVVMVKENKNEIAKGESEAVSLLQKVIELDSHHIGARNLLALLYEKNRKYREALFEYTAALQEEETLLNTRANLSILYYRLGLKDKALHEIERALRIAECADISTGNLLIIKKEVER